MEILTYILGAVAASLGIFSRIVRSGGHRDAGLWLDCGALCFVVITGCCWYQDRLWKTDGEKSKPKEAGYERMEIEIAKVQSTLEELNTEKGSDLAKMFPCGYILFGATPKRYFPLESPQWKEFFELDWSAYRNTSTKDRISMQLPDFRVGANVFFDQFVSFPAVDGSGCEFQIASSNSFMRVQGGRATSDVRGSILRKPFIGGDKPRFLVTVQYIKRAVEVDVVVMGARWDD